MNATRYGALSDAPLSEEFLNTFLRPYLDTCRAERTRVEHERRIRNICTYFYKYRGYDFEFHHLDLEDAKQYFLIHLAGLCQKGELSYDTLCSQLSTARKFASFIAERDDDYENPFYKIQRPSIEWILKPDCLISDVTLDRLLSDAEDFDERLYFLYVLSFRMAMSEKALIGLKTDMITFFPDGHSLIGVISYAVEKKQFYKRIPSDIVQDFSMFVHMYSSEYVFTNRYGGKLNGTTLCKLLDRFEDKYGYRVTLKQLRSKGLLDLVRQNPDRSDDLIDFTGLSEQSIRGYGAMFDKIKGLDSVAERSSYKMFSKSERRFDD